MAKNPEVEKFIADLSKEVARIDDTVEKEQQLLRLQDAAALYHGDDEVVTAEELMLAAKERAQEKTISTGYKGLDGILKGFHPTQLVVVSAATKSGKTTFCMEMSTHMAAEKPLWLSFEESMEELLNKFAEHGHALPQLVSPKQMTGNTLQWVEKKIIEAKVKYNTGVVFIDHLHFIVPFQSERQDLAIGHAMRELKRMARLWNVVIVLIAHIKKTRVDKAPTLEDLRDSSFIAQEADTVIILYRHSYTDDEGDINTTNNVNVSVQANRRTGKTGNVKMVYQEGRFLEKVWNRSEVEVSTWGTGEI